MRAVTAREMQAIDRRAISEFGIPALSLMENAGASVAQTAARLLGGAGGRQIAVLAGRGNNGGDGLVAARHLANAGAEVRVYLAADPDSLDGDAGTQLAIVRRMGLTVTGPPTGSEDLRQQLGKADLCIDALLGTGARGAPRGAVAAMIESLNAAGRRVLAVDIPSGIDPDTGQAELAVRAACTVTLGLPKVGLLLYPAAGYTGELLVADIGFPRAVLQDPAPAEGVIWADAGEVRPLLPARPANSHKGSFGHVLVVAGSWGMSGAALLAGRGALRMGCGLVTLAVPQRLAALVAPALPEALVYPLPESEAGSLAVTAAETVAELAAGRDVLVIGPGLSRHPAAAACVREVVGRAPVPTVVDADGLNALAGHDVLARRPGDVAAPLVLTPHPGEMSRLCGEAVQALVRDVVHTARHAARRWGATVVLKGARTVTASPDGPVSINTTGNPALATGGTGDVLAGAIGSLLAQGLAARAAAVCGVYCHGLAGDIAASEIGPAGVLARDVADRLPAALARLRGGDAS